MLRIYGDVQAMQGEVRGRYERVRTHDSKLADQLRRAAQSVALNMGEGMAATAGTRRRAYATALHEARECRRGEGTGSFFRADSVGSVPGEIAKKRACPR